MNGQLGRTVLTVEVGVTSSASSDQSRRGGEVSGGGTLAASVS